MLTSPLLVIAAVAIKIDSAGLCCFDRSAVGRRGKVFVLYKLRGMHVDARDRWPELYDYERGLD